MDFNIGQFRVNSNSGSIRTLKKLNVTSLNLTQCRIVILANCRKD